MLRLVSLSTAAILCASMAAQQPPNHPKQVLPLAAQKDFEQFAPYWTAEGGWHTDLQLRNNLSGSP
jgi:hypothetical protein